MILPINRKILYREKTLGIQILSKYLAQELEQDEPYFVISISSNSVLSNIKDSKNRKSILRLVFDDAEKGEKAMSDLQASQVREFVQKNLQEGIHSCIIHCEMGVSRSAGVGAAISKVVNGEDFLFFKHYTPNMNCYRKTLNAFVGN